MKDQITEKELEAFQESFDEEKENRVVQRAVTVNGINESCTNEELKRALKNSFSVDVPAGNICNQRRSGRCWMFAGLNVLRAIAMKKLNVTNLELSQAYLQFYDKLEKSNFFLERAYELADEEFNSRLNVFMLDSGIGDGGHFVMFTNLVKKYGVMPIEEMPDLAVSKDTTALNNVLTDYLAQGMMEIRAAKKDGKGDKTFCKIKDKYLNGIYRILCISLGIPPKTFTYEFDDKDKKHQVLKEMTPKQFFDEYISAELDDYVCLCDAPIEGMKKYTKYTCHYVNNVEGGDPVVFFNVPLSAMKKACVDSLKGNDLIWFGADVSTQSLRKDGYLADGILKYNDLFSINYHMNKSERLTYRASFCNHAMTFTGVNLVDETPNRWKVENTWGTDNGLSGFYVMSDKWFDEYVYEVFVNKKYLSEKLLKKYAEAETVEESPFDTLWMEMK